MQRQVYGKSFPLSWAAVVPSGTDGPVEDVYLYPKQS